MDGVSEAAGAEGKEVKPVIVLAATNLPWALVRLQLAVQEDQ